MAERIESAAVLGAGLMGAQIAAHLAGAGIRTHLLDIVPPNATDPKARNKLAVTGLETALKAKPASFYDPDAARLITVGNFEDHLERLRTSDFVIEAVLERMDV